MTADRMRRVDEAMREVLSDAITSELKDPRVGFVTVTAVETSPDLRQARVFVSVLGDRCRAPPLARRAAVGARLPAAAGRRGAAPQAHADARLRLRRHRRPRPADRRAARPRGGRRVMSDNGSRSTREQALRDAPRPRQVPAAPRTSTRTATRSARSPRCSRCSRALGKDAVAFLTADEFPLPYEYRFIELDGLVTEPPADLAERDDGLPGLRQHRPHAGRRAQARGRAASSTSTTTTTTRASARSTTSTRTRRARPRWCGT